jgi:hypothetical protein
VPAGTAVRVAFCGRPDARPGGGLPARGAAGGGENLAEFAGILALDKWTGNSNGRQAVFTRRQRERRYRAVFIDFGYCFHAGEWKFEDIPLRGVYYRNDVYREVTGWESFEPWLTRLETMAAETVWAAANEVPPEWYGGDSERNGGAGGEAAGAAQPHPRAD